MDRSQLRRGAELSSIDVDQMEAAAARENQLVLFGERAVSGPVRNHQDLQQRQARRGRREAPFVDRGKNRIEYRQKAGILLDKIDEGRGVERQRAVPDLPDQSHDLRSVRTWADASIPAHCTLPRPRSARIDSGSGASSASSRIFVTSWATERCCCFARFCSLR